MTSLPRDASTASAIRPTDMTQQTKDAIKEALVSYPLANRATVEETCASTETARPTNASNVMRNSWVNHWDGPTTAAIAFVMIQQGKL